MIEMLDERELATERKRLYGVYPAQVTDIHDPDGQGRVKVRLPWSPDSEQGYEVWARLATMMAGPGRGSWFIPDPRDEVLVAFEGGDTRRPYVLGMLWNGTDAPPESMDKDSHNYKKSIVSRRKIRITLDDTEGHETVTITTPGKQTITVKDGPSQIELADSVGNSVKLTSAGITIKATSKVTVDGATVDVKAGLVNVKAPMSKFSGTVKCDTIIATTVAGSIYQPGIGNLL